MLVACSSDDEDGAGLAGSEAADASATTNPSGDDDASVPLTGVDAGAGADATVTRDAAVDAAPVQTFSGEATYYDADGTGACGFKATPNALMVAAMNKAQYKKSLCGQCIHVKGPKGEVTVRIVDLCPGCSMGDVDLSRQAFQAISPLSAGRVKISWSFVACP